MALNPGTKLGAFEITALLGKGGMGEVYRARDSKLRRDVAIKVLSERFAADAEMLARFEREAQSLARLDHPNVGALYDFQHQNGLHYLVMQLIEGETLAERIARGPLAPETAIALFSQIAEGLEAAHERGIVHRDLKPANIKVTPDDRVKVLDFGIAKTTAGDSVAGVRTPTPTDPAAPTRPMSPTPSNLITGEGALIGTPQYMSPEQARGRPVDRRADIWAFGVCLYEALSGLRPFDGDTFTDVTSSVLRDEPNFAELPAGTPPHVLKLLKRCLEKSLRLRLRDIGEAWFALNHPEEALSESGNTQVAPAVGRFVIQLAEGQRISSLQNSVRVSDDGRTIAMLAYDEKWRRAWLRRLEELDCEPIEGSERAIEIFFSPDGETLGFLQPQRICKVPRSGRPVQAIASIEGRPLSSGWFDADEILWSVVDSPIRRVGASGMKQADVTRLEAGEMMHAVSAMTADGRWLLFVVIGDRDADSVWAMDRRTGGRHLVREDAGGSVFLTPTGHLIYSRAGKVYAIRCAGNPPQCVGEASLMLEGVATSANNPDLALFAVSRSGTLVYVPISRTRERNALYWVTRDGSRTEIKTYMNSAGPRFSPDGEMLAIAGIDNDGRANLYAYDTFRGVFEKLTGGGHNLTPVWHPEGNRLTYTTSAGSLSALMDLSLDVGEPQRVHASEISEWPSSYSPDGGSLLYTRTPSSSRSEIWARSRDGETQCIIDSRGRNGCGQFDPTGGYIAYMSDESGRWDIYVKPFQQAGRRIQVSLDGGSDPVWAPDGRELFYRNGDALMAVSVEREGRFRVGQPRKLFDFPFGSRVSMYAPSFDIHPDGQRFVMTEQVADLGGANQVVVVTNWFEELKRALPWDEAQ